MKKLLALTLVVMVVTAFACRKKEEQPVPQAPGAGAPEMGAPQGPIAAPGMGAPQQPMMGTQGAGMVPKGGLKIVVPENVKGKWSGIRLVVTDKTTNKSQEYEVKLNSDFKIPNSNLKVAVGEFLPDFKMGAEGITSSSNEPNNPAVNIKVFEGGQEIFKGWLYSNFPTIHPFEHPKFRLGLKEGVKKG